MVSNSNSTGIKRCYASYEEFVNDRKTQLWGLEQFWAFFAEAHINLETLQGFSSLQELEALCRRSTAKVLWKIHELLFRTEPEPITFDLIDTSYRLGIRRVPVLTKQFDRKSNYAMWKKLKHPNILKCFKVYEKPIVNQAGIHDTTRVLWDVFIMIELDHRKNLWNYMQNHPILPPQQLFLLCARIARGMAYLHSQNVRNWRLCFEEIMLDEAMIPKLSGFSPICNYPDICEYQPQVRNPLNNAPEAMMNKASKASDVWCFANLVLALLKWDTRKEEQDTLVFMESDCELMCYDHKLSRVHSLGAPIPLRLMLVLKMCWQIHPENRPSFDYLADFFLGLSH